MVRGSLIAVSALCICAATGTAQNGLATHGFGYPGGGLSARVMAMGGGYAEMDPISAVNPASLSRWGAAGLAAQLAPEFTTLRGPAGSDNLRIIRFPLYSSGVGVSNRLMFGFASSTLLDRTWSSRQVITEDVNGEEIEATRVFDNRGAINDVRFALAYDFGPALQVGAGFHVFTGSNRAMIATDYTNSAFGDFAVTTTTSYTGTGASAGVIWTPIDVVSVAASGRTGGHISTFSGDNRLTSANVPGRVGVSAAYTGIPGTIVAARLERVSFSDLDGLGAASDAARDTEDMGVGAEFGGPTIFGAQSVWRAGGRWRNLPYDADSREVKERGFSLGLGLPVGRGRAQIDIALQRLTRTNNSSYRESAWVFGAGLLVRP